MHDKTIIHKPPSGLLKAIRPNLNTQASILNSITYLIPNLRRKNGMARINNVSEICDIDMIMAGYLTAIKPLYGGTLAKSWINVSPYALVNCNAAPNNMANAKNIANFGVLNKAKAFNPSELENDRLAFLLRSGGHLGNVKE